MLFALGLIVLSLYIAACVGIEVISKDPELQTGPDTAHIVEFYFSTLGKTLLTLIQLLGRLLVCLGSIFFAILVLKA